MIFLEYLKQVFEWKWNAALKAAWFSISGRGVPATTLPAVKSGSGLSAFVSIGVGVIVVASIGIALAGTFGGYSLERAYEIANDDGVIYLWRSASILLGSLVFFAMLCWAFARVLIAWMGPRDNVQLFWIGLLMPACLIALVMSWSFTGAAYMVATIQWVEPYITWILAGICLLIFVVAVTCFVLIAHARFTKIFLGVSMTKRSKRMFSQMAIILFLGCFVMINMVGESMEFIPGHQTADRIRAGELPGLVSSAIACRGSAEIVECTVVLWPDEFQRYTVYQDWSLIATATRPSQATVEPASLWQLASDGRVLPWVHLIPKKPEDIVLRQRVASACAVLPDPGEELRFNVLARATLLSRRPTKVVAVAIDNHATFVAELQKACASATL